MTPVINESGDQVDLSKLGVGFQPLRDTAVHMFVPGVPNPGLEKEGLCLRVQICCHPRKYHQKM